MGFVAIYIGIYIALVNGWILADRVGDPRLPYLDELVHLPLIFLPTHWLGELI